MLRFLLTAFVLPVLVLLSGCGPLDEVAESTVAITPNVKTDACATGYTRATPNYCSHNSPSAFTLTSNSSCRSLDYTAIWGLPTTVTRVRIAVNATIVSANTIAFRQVTTAFYTDSGCLTAAGAPSVVTGAREWAAVVATTVYSLSPFSTFEMNIGASGLGYYFSSLSSCVNCSHSVTLLGYYD